MVMNLIEIITTGIGLLFSLGVIFLTLIASWKLFEKAGLQGWKGLIPIYNIYCLYQMAFGKGKGWYIICLLVPCVNVILFIVFCVKLANAFNQGMGYAIGLIFLTPIFMMLLAFGDARYIGERLD
ncbi:DUF5684 domain-containing protein [Faecalimonas sp.]